MYIRKKTVILFSVLIVILTICMFFILKSTDSKIYLLIEDDEIKIKHSLTKDQNIIVVYNQDRANNTFDIGQLIVQDKDSNNNDFTGDIVMKSATDFISPYGLLAVNDSNNDKGFTVGGAHTAGEDNEYPTSRFGGLNSINLDGVELNQDGFYEGENLSLEVSHYIYASNTINDHRSRDSMLENRVYKISDREHNVQVSMIALEDVILTRYAGLQLVQSDFYDNFKFSSISNTFDIKKEPEGHHTLSNKSFGDVHTVAMYNDTSMLTMTTDRDFGIGDGSLAPTSTEENPQSPMTFTGGEFGKIYAHNLGRNNNKVHLKEGDSLSYSGSYKFLENNIWNRISQNL